MMDADVIVIGAGLAGLMGAESACRQGAKVLLLARKTIGLASNSAIANGVFGGPTSSCGPDEYIRETLLIGKRLNSLPHIEAVARGIGPAMAFLRDAGCNIVEKRGQYTVHAARPDLIPGRTLMERVAVRVKGSPGLTVQAGFHVLDILTHEGRVCGVEGIDKAGRRLKIYAPAVILASGGAGAIYRRNDNQKSALGQGYAMALRTGLELRDMEFVQFYPFVQAEPGVPPILLYPPAPKKAKLINAAGQDLAAKYALGSINDMILKKRDALSALLHDEMLSGPVYMDFREVPSSDWDRHPLAMLGKLKFDFKHKPFAVAPAAHFFMGGILTDPETRTRLPGLFACGEVAWGLHGANRRGGNALAECMVFGQIAGESAARWGLSHPTPQVARTADHPTGRGTGRSSAMPALRQLGRRIREIAWRHAGVVRSAEGLGTGLASLRGSEAELKGVAPGSAAETIKRADLLGACLVLRAIFSASLARKESLGGFKRKDFPDEQDKSSYGNSSIRYDGASDRMMVSFSDAAS